MSEHPHATLVRRGFEAFNRADADTLREIMTPDCVQHVPGHHVLSGSHEGLDAVLAMYGRIGELTQGTFRADLQDVYATDDEVVAVYRATGDRDGRHLDTRHALVFTVRDGRVSAIREIALDVELDDLFWAGAQVGAPA